MFQIYFLIVIALIWMIFASINDLRKREIADWLNFSLIIFVLGFRFFYSLFFDIDFGFFYQGLIGLAIFFILGNLFYYSKIFAGGDAKLMYSLGVILPFSKSFMINVKFFLLFLLLFLIVGMVYGLFASFILMIKNFKKFKSEFRTQFKENKKLVFKIGFLGVLLMGIGLLEAIFFPVGVLVFFISYLYIYSKAIDESCMVKKLKVNDLTQGDWLYDDVKVGKRLIKANWEGLEIEEVKFLQKNKKFVWIKQGIAYAPTFLFAFVGLVLLYFNGALDYLDWFFRF